MARTLGPWKYWNYEIVGAPPKQTTVCKIIGNTDDARLISAAPELLEACLNALGVYRALKLIGANTALPGYDHCLEFLENAIAKAEGK
jgi:hypothetical protein